jgi:hypothetical protein
MDSLKSEHVTDWLHVKSGQLWSFQLVEDASNQLHICSYYHSVLNDGSHDQSEHDVKDFFENKLSYPSTRYQRSHRVIFSYWRHHQHRNISEEGCRTRRWSKYYAKDEVAHLGLNRGVWSVIANQLVARLRTKVHQDWWRVQGLVMIPQFSLDRGPLKMKYQTSRTSHEDVGSNKHHMKVQL